MNVYKHCDDARSQEVTEIAFEQHRASSTFSKKIAAAQKNVDEAGNENALAAAKEELANVLKKQEESRERLRAKEKESEEKYNKCKQDAEQ